MSSKSSPMLPLLLAAVAAGGVAYGIHRLAQDARVAPAQQSAQPAKPRWAAVAQGRVEPKTGEVRISTTASGRVDELLIGVNDRVKAGDLLARIEDSEPLARMLAADAEAGVRKRERDTETNVPRLAIDRRNAEDKLNTTERALATARLALDTLLIARHASPSSVSDDQITAARGVIDEAARRVPGERDALRQAQLAAGVPLPTRLEAGLTAARSDLTLAETALERTRIRAPFDGVILQVMARVGEVAAATPEAPLFVIGDLSQLKVRAEVEERDASRVSVGQEVMLKTDAFPDREFTGKVSSVAQAMRPPRLGQRGPRRPNDLDTLEVMIDVDAGTPLLPGMRVDAHFKLAPSTSKPEAPRAALPTEGGMSASVASAIPGAAAANASVITSSTETDPKVLPPLPAAQPKAAGN